MNESPDSPDDRIKQLEEENSELKKRLSAIEEMIGETAKSNSSDENDGKVPVSRRGVMTALAGAGALGIGATGTTAAQSSGIVGERYAGNPGTVLELENTSSNGFSYGLTGIVNADLGRGVYGYAKNTSGESYGVYGVTDSTDGKALFGNATAGSGPTEGLQGRSQSSEGTGVLGDVTASTGSTVGVKGESFSKQGTGVYGEAKNSSGTTYGIRGDAQSPNGYGLYTPDNALIGQDLEVEGTKHFVQAVETVNGPKEVVYTSVESGTPRTETNGVAEMEDGLALVKLPDHFGFVTSNDEDITVQVTAYAEESAQPQVVDRSTNQITVRDFGDTPGNYSFAYTVKGVRQGFEDQETLRDA
jgi:hypothetical protein